MSLTLTILKLILILCFSNSKCQVPWSEHDTAVPAIPTDETASKEGENEFFDSFSQILSEYAMPLALAACVCNNLFIIAVTFRERRMTGACYLQATTQQFFGHFINTFFYFLLKLVISETLKFQISSIINLNNFGFQCRPHHSGLYNEHKKLKIYIPCK